jgi:hypothetical protein
MQVLLQANEFSPETVWSHHICMWCCGFCWTSCRGVQGTTLGKMKWNCQ